MAAYKNARFERLKSSEIITEIRGIVHDALKTPNLDMRPTEYINSIHYGADIKTDELNLAMDQIKEMYEILQERDQRGETFGDWLWDNSEGLYIINRYYTTLQKVDIALRARH